LRPGVACCKPAQLAPDLLPELVQIDELAGRDRGLGQRLEQGALTQHLGRVRQQIDADPERTQLLDRFIDARPDAHTLERERGGEPADPRADDDDVHGAYHSPFPPLTATTAAHFSASVAIRRAKSSGEPGASLKPSFARLACSVAARSRSLTTALSLLTIAGGVPVGAT